jgi:hypothetical protein
MVSYHLYAGTNISEEEQSDDTYLQNVTNHAAYKYAWRHNPEEQHSLNGLHGVTTQKNNTLNGLHGVTTQKNNTL